MIICILLQSLKKNMKRTVTSHIGPWIKSNVNDFWNNIAVGKPIFYTYDEDSGFADILVGFVGTGINANSCAIIIATPAHLERIKLKLQSHGLHVGQLIEDERYIPVDAEKIVDAFMVGGKPDEALFYNCISNLTEIGRRRNRSIRIFREIVTVLKDRGNEEASQKLEKYWNDFLQKEQIAILCAYPRNSVTMDECEFYISNSFTDCITVTNANSISHILYQNCP
jgi:hypothetical protein